MTVFTDTVKYNNCIIHRESDDSQNRGNEVLVNFQREWYYILEERKYGQRYEHVVQQTDNGTERVSPVAESQKDIRDDCKNGKDHSLDSPPFQIL